MSNDNEADKLPPSWPTAFLLDLDGTLIDSDHAHRWAFNQILAPHGVQLGVPDFERLVVGNNNEAIMLSLVPHLELPLRTHLAVEKEKLVLENLDRLALCAGAAGLMQSAHAASRPIAVVTNAPRQNAAEILAHFDLMRWVTMLVAAEDTDSPKPDPKPYREAMRTLGVAPQEAVAFEDSIGGVTAAARAGVRVYGVTGGRAEAPLLNAGATACVRGLAQVRFSTAGGLIVG
jgi:HAD superfamily hydrolase (TIGR01509 family)